MSYEMVFCGREVVHRAHVTSFGFCPGFTQYEYVNKEKA